MKEEEEVKADPFDEIPEKEVTLTRPYELPKGVFKPKPRDKSPLEKYQ